MALKPVYQKVIDTIPDYQVFLTPDELDESSRALAAEFPEVVELSSVGTTRAGRDLICLRIGEPCGAGGDPSAGGPSQPAEDRPAAVVLGVPHPNEPIGCMLIEHFTRCLAADRELRDELGYTWYFVKAWDADSLALNTWIKGPYTITNYSRNFFRPASDEQVEWTFPIDYKTLHFHEPLPETRAAMRLIDLVKPGLIFSLHDFGLRRGLLVPDPQDPRDLGGDARHRRGAGPTTAPGRAGGPLRRGVGAGPLQAAHHHRRFNQEQYGTGDPADMITGGTSGSTTP